MINAISQHFDLSHKQTCSDLEKASQLITEALQVNAISQHVDVSPNQACSDLEKASQLITEALQSEVQRNMALRMLIHRLEERASENGRSLLEQVASNRRLKLQVDKLQKHLKGKDNSLTEANQAIAVLKNKLRDLQQQLQSHQSSHGTIQEVTAWLQEGESQHTVVKGEDGVLQTIVIGIKKEEDDDGADPPTEQTTSSSADIKDELVQIKAISQHVDVSHEQACSDLEKASQLITEALQRKVQRNMALRMLVHRLEERASENGRSLSEQVESNRRLKLQVDKLQKHLKGKDNSLTEANQAIAVLKNELRDLQQQLQSHQSSHGTIQEVTVWLQEGESQHTVVKGEESLLQPLVIGIKKEDADYNIADKDAVAGDNDDGHQYGADPPTEQTTSSPADIKAELVQEDEGESAVAPGLSSGIQPPSDPVTLRSLSVQLVDCCTTQANRPTTETRSLCGRKAAQGDSSDVAKTLFPVDSSLGGQKPVTAVKSPPASLQAKRRKRLVANTAGDVIKEIESNEAGGVTHLEIRLADKTAQLAAENRRLKKEIDRLKRPPSHGQHADVTLRDVSPKDHASIRCQSRGQVGRYGCLLFRSIISEQQYRDWSKTTNWNGSRGKRALPQNVKKFVISTLQREFPSMGGSDLKDCIDKINEYLRITRRSINS
ncbi:hypothetical protein ACEWY4_017264 [Coilia grayii]|uniref:Uncharacterized protein n=1 Tax=Coilia grayii TaxID=363190 RepID=A0ABD1JIK9_9TELE